MNNNKKKKSRRSRLSRQIVIQYFLSLFGFFILFFIFVMLSYRVCKSITWQPYNILYQFLTFVRDYIIIFAGLPLIAGVVAITYYYLSKPLRYLDDVIDASGRLITFKDTPVELPPEMRDIEDELNLFREQALRNELLAKEAEQRKNDLIVYLAHDLKTPLTSVIGYLTLLRDEPQISPELRARYTVIALEKAERLEELINEFFDITRFNLNALTLEPELTNLTMMLEQIAYEFKPVLSEKNLTINTNLAPNVEFFCDRNKLERVFDNLLRNAVNYSYRDTEIYLSLEKVNGGVCIIVSNHGKTIPADKLNRIFEQFFRLDSSRSTSTGGSGLGLAIAKEIVELHGGIIQAESENETIKFTIFLPDRI